MRWCCCCCWILSTDPNTAGLQVGFFGDPCKERRSGAVRGKSRGSTMVQGMTKGIRVWPGATACGGEWGTSGGRAAWYKTIAIG